MRIAIYSNLGEASNIVATSLKKKIEASKALKIDGLNPEIVISVGGDGTLLSAFHHYQDISGKIRLVGIHTGHLGFYTDWRDYEVSELVESLEHDNGQSVTYPLLDIKVNYAGGGPADIGLALNESTLKQINGSMVADVYIKNQLFESFRGDGLCVSTPSGSTAYNKSVGGAIINPSLNAIQVSEISSINNRVFRTLGSPLIIAPDEWVKIIPKNNNRTVLTCDHQVISTATIASVEYRISQRRIAFAQYRHTQFWRRVSNSFIGEVNLDD
ncbi:NAD kinase [Lentilactobacillus diolivorans]|uniref:NAD kinase n=2 Tax=Lentilactobacillus diolivorans TaxID=179838 RepID=A0A0R1S3C6_9LACO|nr:NAD kinase [Lentilactobacillus diolivorans]KRL63734.1 inorganic polyphosphate ATP-NAD kinase [Lentilactobacillus diolivorans DSM 14421]GEP24004.1 NAD kinase [Lentilactobacillus diolivorans]